MRTQLLAPILVLMPPDWRRGLQSADSINWRRAAVISGLVQAIVALSAYIAWYYHATGHWAHQAIHAAVQAHPDLNVGSGTVGSLTFVVIALHPLTWILWYFSIEGILRTINARANVETPGTLPLRLIDRGMRFAKYGEWSAQHRVKDEVTCGEGNGDLKISSGQPKRHWKYPLTIRYQGEFFQVHGEEHVAAVSERPHIYLLRRLPANEIIRGLENYDTEESFAEDNPPGFFATVYGEMRKKLAK
ncbi:MAG: hypothetical protein WBE20_13800 [Candidatus Acidiferrales bacterium]